jgi:hypothetical protein
MINKTSHFCEVLLYYRGMKKIILSSIFISAFILLGSVYQASALANPASVKCNLDGGISVIQKDANGGEYSNCKFPDGSVCEEWAYYRGECSPKKPLTLDQLSTSCTSAFDGCNNCFRASGGQWACTMMACMGEQKSATCKNTGSDTDTKKPTICTKEYAPVCGQPKMPECKDGMICAQVMPAQKTYGNKCMMQADGASFVSEGACNTSTYNSCPAAEVDGPCTLVTTPKFCLAPIKSIKRGSRGNIVKELQTALLNQGYYKGNIDGIFGQKLASAVKEFQKRHNMKNDGIFGNSSKDKLCGYQPTFNAGN